MAKNVYFAQIIVLLCLFSLRIHSFTTLQQVQNYANEHKEFPAFENKDIFNPEYTKWYSHTRPSFIRNLFSFIKKPDWSISEFKNLFSTMLQERLKKGYETDHVVVAKPKPGTALILF